MRLSQKQRAIQHAAGLRPLVIWVPDTENAGFAKECRRQCLSLLSDPQEAEILTDLQAFADVEGWDVASGKIGA